LSSYLSLGAGVVGVPGGGGGSAHGG